MKTSTIFLIVCFSIIFNSISFGQTTSTILSSTNLGNKDKLISPERFIINNNEVFIELEYKIENIFVSNKNVNGVDYQYLNVKDFDYMDEVGNPAIPSHIDIIAMPEGARPLITIVASEYIEYQGYNLHPVLELASDSIGAPEPSFELNTLQYDKNAFFPSKLVEVVEFQKMREAGLTYVEVRPVQFNPVTKTIRVYSKIQYKVEYINPLKSFQDLALNNSINYLNVLNNVALNSDVLPKRTQIGGVRSGANANYIIITHPDYLTSAQDLADWKMQLGYTVEIVSKSGWTYTEIKDSLSLKYNSYSPRPDYVVFIGDVDKVPGEIINSNFATDLYYVCMDGSSDYTADMARGRISIANASEAAVAVQKIINYEKTPVADPAFYTLGLNCAEFQDSDDDGYADRRFSLTSENVYDYLNGVHSFNISRVYGSGSTNPTNWNNGAYAAGEPLPSYLLKPGFPWNGSGTDVRDQMNIGQLYVLHRDHGYSQGWGTPGFNSSYIPSLTNGNRLPVMFSVNCSSGDLLAPASFAEQLLRHSGGGAVGVIAASDISYSGLNDAFVLGLFDAIWDSPGLIPNFTGSGGTGNTPTPHNHINKLGEVLNQGLIRMAETWSNSQRTNELFHYHGDPSMKIWTDVPTQISATHPTQINCNSTSITITNASCLDALATICFNGEIIGSTYLVNGNGTINCAPITNIVPNVILTLSKDNHIPYVANLPIVNCALAPLINFEASTYSEIFCGGVTTPITFSDLSYYGPTQWTWNFTPNTVTFVNSTTANSQYPEVEFNAPGMYSIQLIASNAFGSDTLYRSNYIDIIQGATLPFEEGFESGIFPPEGWELTNPDSNITWELNTADLANGQSTASVFLDYYHYNANGEKDELQSPRIDLTSSTDAKLDFKISYKQFSNWVDSLNVYISTDCGSTFQLIYNKGGADLVTTPSQASGVWVPSVITDWRTESIDLSAYSGQIVIVKFQGVTGYGNSLYLDDINIYSASMLPETDFVASETEILCKGTTEVINFTDITKYSAYSYNWSFSPNTVTYMNATNANSQHPAVVFNSTGTYQVSLMTTNLNGSDTEVKTNYINISEGNIIPFEEGFETSIGIPSDWTVENPDNDKTWSLNINASGNGNSTASAFINYFSYSNFDEYDNLISPNINLINVADAYLSFNLAYQQFGGYVDSLTITVSIDCGETYDTIPVYAKSSVDLETVSGGSNFVPSISTDWRQEIVDLSQYVGEEIKVKFEGYCGFGNNLYLDDINIYHTPVTGTGSKAKDKLLVNVFPNPTNGLVTVDIQNLPNKNFSLELLDAIGQNISSRNINHDGNVVETLDLSNYSSGLYFICLRNDERVVVKKVVVE
ncbi:MAG: C25 family cysteine peptidase [Saprospiraceae bacterium]|nr:C25 family cysteine peptidase [Saprospiraceae bacterium]